MICIVEFPDETGTNILSYLCADTADQTYLNEFARFFGTVMKPPSVLPAYYLLGIFMYTNPKIALGEFSVVVQLPSSQDGVLWQPAHVMFFAQRMITPIHVFRIPRVIKLPQANKRAD